MKIRIELDENLIEDEVLIRCRSLDENVRKIQETVSQVLTGKQQLICYKEDTEYYLSLDEILFFETETKEVWVHTTDKMYQTRYKLYELEELLPGHFMRVSKSTILNTNRIYSITRNLTASSVVEFMGSHKQVYVSRYYYKPLKCKLEEKRENLLGTVSDFWSGIPDCKQTGTGGRHWLLDGNRNNIFRLYFIKQPDKASIYRNLFFTGISRNYL